MVTHLGKFSNVELLTKAQAYPTDLDLRMNESIVQDIDWGKGRVEIDGSWEDPVDSIILGEFSAYDTGKLGAYSIDLTTDLNLYAIKHSPETFYAPRSDSVGLLLLTLLTRKIQLKFKQMSIWKIVECLSEIELAIIKYKGTRKTIKKNS